MNKKLFLSVPLLAFTFAGCNEQIEDGLESSLPNLSAEGSAIVATIEGQTKTALDNNMYVVWSLNDQIRVFGASASSGAVYTTASDGERTAIFTPVGDDVIDASRYAVYPASAVEGAKLDGQSINVDFSNIALQDYSAALTSSSNISGMPMVASSTNDSFVFKNLCGGIRVQLNNFQMAGIKVTSVAVAGNDGELISGKAAVNLTTASVTLAKGSDAGTSVAVNCSTPVSIAENNNPSAHTDFVVFLPASTYEKGLTVKVTDSEGRIYTQSTEENLEVEPGVVTPMELLPITLYYGTANCYLTNKAGTVDVDITPYYTLSPKFVYENNPCLDAQGNYVKPAASASVVWSQTNSNESGEVLSGDPKVEGNTLKVPVSGVHGNALIAIKDEQGTVLWSFHIWVSETNDVKYVNADRGTFTMLDRNLGATSITPKDRNTYGVIYQWGRKDPFPYALNFERPAKPYTNDVSDIITTTALTAATGNISYTIQHPDVRILTSSDDTDWHWGYRINALWGNDIDKTVNKTVYDPSPAGYCIADYACFSGLVLTSKDECNNNYGMNFVVDGSSTSFYPTSGYYDATKNLLYYGEYRGHIWTSSVDDASVKFFYYNNTDVVVKESKNRAYGYTTRCVKLEK